MKIVILIIGVTTDRKVKFEANLEVLGDNLETLDIQSWLARNYHRVLGHTQEAEKDALAAADGRPGKT